MHPFSSFWQQLQLRQAFMEFSYRLYWTTLCLESNESLKQSRALEVFPFLGLPFNKVIFIMLILLFCFYYYNFFLVWPAHHIGQLKFGISCPEKRFASSIPIPELASITTANFSTYITFKIYPKVTYYTRL